jgi:hypothetical protein
MVVLLQVEQDLLLVTAERPIKAQAVLCATAIRVVLTMLPTTHLLVAVA